MREKPQQSRRGGFYTVWGQWPAASHFPDGLSSTTPGSTLYNRHTHTPSQRPQGCYNNTLSKSSAAVLWCSTHVANTGVAQQRTSVYKSPVNMTPERIIPLGKPQLTECLVSCFRSVVKGTERSLFDCRTSGASMPRNSMMSGFGGTEKIKDARPLHDKSYVQQCIRQLHEVTHTLFICHFQTHRKVCLV